MRLVGIAFVLAVSAGLAGPAAAQLRPLSGGGDFSNAYGDDSLSYKDGVVYDDDLVPGRPGNQPFLVDEQGGSGSSASSPGYRTGVSETRQNSQQLIGPDGRLTTTTRGVRYTD